VQRPRRARARRRSSRRGRRTRATCSDLTQPGAALHWRSELAADAGSGAPDKQAFSTSNLAAKAKLVLSGKARALVATSEPAMADARGRESAEWR
jgi:hypothetical protein